MRSSSVNHLPTSQGASAYIYHHHHKHAGGTGSVATQVKFPKHMSADGFPTDAYNVSVTPDQPLIVSIGKQDKYGFDLTLTSPNGGVVAEGTLSVLVIG
jgi:hypothetical protein